MLRRLLTTLVITGLLLPAAAHAARTRKAEDETKKSEEKKDPMNPGTFAGLALRGIGPALTSGRIIDLAVDPTDAKTYYVAVASGGVWKTTNAGTTYEPIFDGEGSYSIGCVTIDPTNPLVIWVGSGENNSQRSVGYGDGVYKSLDGGKSWKNVGLKDSEHIGRIVVDPRDSDIVYVAAQGPLWGPGGDRGLYKSADGGETWEKILEISENTGVTDVLLDPRDPDTIYAAAYQRRRRVWTLLDGGPESGLHKSTDGGKTWKKLSRGLPAVEMGRIGLALSPQNPDVVYAIVEAQEDAGGFFRSADRGESWEKRGGYVSGSPQYYQELFPDPNVFDRVYSADFLLQVTDDGGKSWRNAGEEYKHVDNHAVWINPADSDHLLVGCDGGIYESFDRGSTWNFRANLPVTQFYKVATDEALPFYNIFGGTQDNFSLGGPSRTTSANGITNADWFVTQGGDGFESQVEPTNPDIIYAQSQHGGLGRFDRASGEILEIQPQPTVPGEALRWNWDAPLLVSPHSPTRLYFAANKLFRSDDRGSTWVAVSPDLTRQIDRNKLAVMGKVWSVDAVAKNRSTSFYGTIVAFDESPLIAGLLYVGTDDGLIQVSEDGGENWRRIETFPGVPERTYVSYLLASRQDPDTVYAAFDAHKDADFKPYALKSQDRGKTWTSIVGDLPERGSVYSLAEDHEKPGLLFAGTEFGVYFTLDTGAKWIRLSGGIPTVAVKDLAIQRRENDLVLATFGRGFFVLDDYTPLRHITPELLAGEAALFPVKQTFMYMEEARLGLPGPGFQGHSYFTAPNPPSGAVFTYYLKEAPKTLKEKRQEAEKKIAEEGGTLSYPSWDELRAEDQEEKAQLLFTVTDVDGNVVERLTAPARPGIQRISWDLRFPSSMPTRLAPPPSNPFFSPPPGPMVAPGTYTVSLGLFKDGEITNLAEPRSFDALPLGLATLPAADKEALLAFQQKTGRLQRAVTGATRALGEAQERLSYIRKALLDTPAADPALAARARQLELRFGALETKLSGDSTIESRSEPTPPSIVERVQRIVFGAWTSSTSAPTTTGREQYDLAAQAFGPVLAELTAAIEGDLARLEADLETAGAPWTPGRVPRWQPE